MRTLETYRVPANSTCINVSLFARAIRRVSVNDQLRKRVTIDVFREELVSCQQFRERFQSRAWRRQQAVSFAFTTA